jgi:hypothetical protein
LVPTEKADAIFFVGRGETEVPIDVIELDCDDSYQGIPEKVREIARWAKAKGYTFMLKCDDDVVLRPSALLYSGYEKYEYSGRANRPPQPYTVPFGFNYMLNKKCIDIISEAPLPDGSNDDEKWVAKNLWDHGIELTDDSRYFLHSKLLEPPVNARRPLRAPIRPTPYVEKEPEYFSRCIYLFTDLDTKLEEFKKVFNRFVRGT